MTELKSNPEALRSAAVQGLKHADSFENMVSRSHALADTGVFGSDPLGLIAAALHTDRMRSLLDRLQAFPGQHREHWEGYRVMADRNEVVEQNLADRIQHLDEEM